MHSLHEQAIQAIDGATGPTKRSARLLERRARESQTKLDTAATTLPVKPTRRVNKAQAQHVEKAQAQHGEGCPSDEGSGNCSAGSAHDERASLVGDIGKPLLVSMVSAAPAIPGLGVNGSLVGGIKAVPNKACTNCGATSTPCWRRGKHGDVLCNRCAMWLRGYGTLPVTGQQASSQRRRGRGASQQRSSSGSGSNTEAAPSSTGVHPGALPVPLPAVAAQRLAASELVSLAVPASGNPAGLQPPRAAKRTLGQVTGTALVDGASTDASDHQPHETKRSRLTEPTPLSPELLLLAEVAAMETDRDVDGSDGGGHMIGADLEPECMHAADADASVAAAAAELIEFMHAAAAAAAAEPPAARHRTKRQRATAGGRRRAARRNARV